jgi:RecA-family ATPase
MAVPKPEAQAALQRTLAKQSGSQGTRPKTNGQAGQTCPNPPSIAPIDFTALPDAQPPPRHFLIEDWLPALTLSSLYGPGGIGKTLLAQQIATCLATGTSIFGLKIQQTSVLALFSEDDNEELQRRQWYINQHYGIVNKDLKDLHIEGRSGATNDIVQFPGGRPEIEPLFESIVAKAKSYCAGLIILDNRAQMILGNENDRMVATYGANVLARIGREANAAVLLLGHVAKPEGSEYSGSTAWDAVTRSRWWLRRADGSDPGTTPECCSPARNRTTRPQTTPFVLSGKITCLSRSIRHI